MKKKHLFELKVEKNGKEYVLQCEPTSSLGDLFDALVYIQTYVLDVMKESVPKKKIDECDKAESSEKDDNNECEDATCQDEY